MDTAADIKKEDKKGSYRDSVATITKDGKRNYINPKKPKGRLYNLRTRFSIFYLLVFFTLPFINKAKNIVFLISGENKAAIIKKIFSKSGAALPAAMVKATKNTFWFLDDAAAGH